MNSSKFRDGIWTAIVVTIVTILIWAWAAGETLEQRQVTLRLNFVARDVSAWIVRPSTNSATVTVEGPTRALQEFAARADTPLNIELGWETLPATPGTHSASIESLLANHPDLHGMSVRIVDSKPATIEVEVDERVRAKAEIRAELTGVQTEGEVIVQPRTAQITMPGRLREKNPGTLYLTARADPVQLASLEADRTQTLVLNVVLPTEFAGATDVSFTPTLATVTFNIRSQIRELHIDTVRVHISGTPENADEYHIAVEPKQLSNITIRADGELIRRIERESIPVVAFVHLTSLELEQHLTNKPVTYFMAMVPNAQTGGTTGVAIAARTEDSDDSPTIQLTITERAPPP